jgi:hypothetical protein
MPYGFKNLQPRKKSTILTQQLTKSQDFRQNYLCESISGCETTDTDTRRDMVMSLHSHGRLSKSQRQASCFLLSVIRKNL